MKKLTYHLLIFFFCYLVLPSTPASAQLAIGQYEDEAPLRTWNTFGIPSASAVGIGETQFAIVADSSAAVVNPARLTALSPFSITLSGSYTTSSFDKYAVVNTGVLFTEGNSSTGVYALDFAGVTLNYRGWALGMSIGLFENYERPFQNPDYEEGGEVLYLFEFQQNGLLRNLNISVAREFGGWFSFGIGLNYVFGSMEKEIVENMYYSGVTISDRKSHDYSGIYVNGGLAADISDKLTVAAVLRTPYSKNADSESKLQYDSPPGNTDIRIEAAAKNKYKQPLVLGIGIDYRFSPQLRVASDVSFFNWSSYSINYFDEEIKRDFKNIVKVSGGLEYMGSIRLFQQDFQVPFRAGLSYDPQPVKEPKTHYMYYTLGFGLYWKGLHLDAGAMLGSEKSSGSNLYGRKFSISLSYFL
jgi:long-subunit fatty acid transport protein